MVSDELRHDDEQQGWWHGDIWLTSDDIEPWEIAKSAQHCRDVAEDMLARAAAFDALAELRGIA